MIGIIAAWWLKRRLLIYVVGGLLLATNLTTAVFVWSKTSSSCETSALKATVKDEGELNEIRNRRPDDAKLLDSLHNGTF